MSGLEGVFAEFEEEEKEAESETEEKPEKTVKKKPKKEVKEKKSSKPKKKEPKVEEEVSVDDIFGESEDSEDAEEESEEIVLEAEEVIEVEPEKKKSKTKFDLSEEKPTGQKADLIYGLKGSGKTVLAESYPGKVAVISFDRKATKVKMDYYNGDKRIKVFDGIRYLETKTADKWLETAKTSYEYLIALIDGPIKDFGPDTIVIDGTEIMIGKICEMAMRYDEGFKAFQTFTYKFWEERNMLVDNIHLGITALAKDGVVYTAYVKEVTETIEHGVIVEQKYAPKWAANIKLQVDTVIYIESKQNEDQREFWITVESSKDPDILTGLNMDITDKGIKDIWAETKKRKKKRSKSK